MELYPFLQRTFECVTEMVIGPCVKNQLQIHSFSLEVLQLLLVGLPFVLEF